MLAEASDGACLDRDSTEVTARLQDLDLEQRTNGASVGDAIQKVEVHPPVARKEKSERYASLAQLELADD